MIAGAPGSDVATVTLPHTFEAYVVDRESLDTRLVSPLPPMGSPARPAERAGWAARFDRSGRATVVDLEEREAWSTSGSPALMLTQTAVSPDATKVALSSESSTFVWDSAREEPIWEEYTHGGVESPMRVEVDDEGVATMLSRTGRVFRTDGTQSVFTDFGGSFSTGAVLENGMALFVSRDGRVLQEIDAALQLVGHVSRDLAPFAAELAPNNAHVAFIGAISTEVMSLSTGQVVLELTSDTAYNAVTDVLFDTDGEALIALRLNGTLSRWPLHDLQGAADFVRGQQPRLLTDDERQLFQLSTAELVESDRE